MSCVDFLKENSAFSGDPIDFKSEIFGLSFEIFKFFRGNFFFEPEYGEFARVCKSEGEG